MNSKQLTAKILGNFQHCEQIHSYNECPLLNLIWVTDRMRRDQEMRRPPSWGSIASTKCELQWTLPMTMKIAIIMPRITCILRTAHVKLKFKFSFRAHFTIYRTDPKWKSNVILVYMRNMQNAYHPKIIIRMWSHLKGLLKKTRHLKIPFLCSWIKIDQHDATCFIISLFNAQHVSNVSTSIFRSLRLICWVI